MRSALLAVAATLLALGCSATAGGGPPGPDPCDGVGCSGHGRCVASGGSPVCRCDPGYERSAATSCTPSQVPTIGGCAVLPADHLFNTPIDGLPVHPSSGRYLATIGAHRLHLDLGRQEDTTAADYWGIPYNVVSGDALAWTAVAYRSPDPGMSWDPRAESDCAVAAAGGGHARVSPCSAAAAPAPVFPVPPSPLVEGGISTASDHRPYGDHHLLLLDADACFLWELYHVYHPSRGWEIFGSAGFDLGSNALRPDGWTSADAAGFPILPLLLRADEAGTGTIRHALRFTIPTGDILDGAYTWPARHAAGSGTSQATDPAMGQLFRLKASYAIPAGFHPQSRAILQAMKTYGLYLADGGSALYVQGEPSAAWAEQIFAEVQSLTTDDFEAVDLAPVRARAGFDPNSARVPP